MPWKGNRFGDLWKAGNLPNPFSGMPQERKLPGMPGALHGPGFAPLNGSSGSPNSFRNPLCLAAAVWIAFSMSTKLSFVAA